MCKCASNDLAVLIDDFLVRCAAPLLRCSSTCARSCLLGDDVLLRRALLPLSCRCLAFAASERMCVVSQLPVAIVRDLQLRASDQGPQVPALQAPTHVCRAPKLVITDDDIDGVTQQLTHKAVTRPARDKYTRCPVSDLDLSNCERCTPSYVRLPADYPTLTFTARCGLPHPLFSARC